MRSDKPRCSYFNSIKVQLKRRHSASSPPESRFQFHKGTIKTKKENNIRRIFSNFNSIKVQLKPLASLLAYCAYSISIP